MPADERLGFDDHQGTFPIEQPKPDDDAGAGGVGRSPWLGLPFFTVGQLFSQEEEFGADSGGANGQSWHKSRSPSRTKSTVNRKKETDERTALEKHRDMGRRDGTGLSD
jgi:hypothetical protein